MCLEADLIILVFKRRMITAPIKVEHRKRKSEGVHGKIKCSNRNFKFLRPNLYGENKMIFPKIICNSYRYDFFKKFSHIKNIPIIVLEKNRLSFNIMCL